MPSALDGLTVLDLSDGPAAALATMLLADHGARVLRIVAPGTPHLRDGGFIVWDRGKECARLDLDAAVAVAAGDNRPAAKQALADLDRLIAGADILIEDFAPSSPLQRLIGWPRLKKINPRLVSCSVTAYGKHGPDRDEPPIDDLVLARIGLLSAMPGFRPAPVHVVHPLPSVGAALYAAIGIAAALLAREKTGRGRAVETSLMDGALLYATKVTAEKAPPHTFQTHPSGSAPFYSVYPCADGKYVQLGCVHIGFITTAANLLGIGDLVQEPRFNGGRGGISAEADDELRATLTRLLRAKPFAHWSQAFEDADVPFGEARWSEEGLEDAQVIHNGMVVELDDPAAGSVMQMGVPVHLTATPGRVPGPRRAKAVPASEVSLPRLAQPSPPQTSPEIDPPPLAGVRILEITNLIAGPTAGRILADLGADVIKLEPPTGDMSRPIGRTYFYSVNFNKRSLCIETGTPAGKSVVQRIAATVDAVVANLRPHATERMGISPAVNPNLIETHLTGYGWTGPYAKRPGIDPLAQALMGLQRAQGGPDNPPVFPAQLAPTDFTTGAMGTLGTILALYARARTGVVQRVESNLLSGGIVLSSVWFTRYAGKPVRPLADREQYGLGPFHRLFRLVDGWIYVVAESEAQRRAVCEVAGVAMPTAGALNSTSGRHANSTPFAEALAAVMHTKRVAPVLASLKAAGVPCAESPPADSALFLADPIAAENAIVAVRPHPKVGRLSVAWQAVRFRETAPSAGLPTPLLGEHTTAVLREAGYSDAAIASLHANGTVRTEVT